MIRLKHLAVGAVCAATALLAAGSASAWGNDGHRVIALIARKYIDMNPAVAAKVDAILSGPLDPPLAAGANFAELGTWGDRYRDSSAARRTATRQWHFVDLAYGAPDANAACFGFPVLAPGQAAVDGAAADCVVDKINQFRKELAAPGTSPAERKLALLFLLHFVGDLHQPLHAAERNHDAGGNGVFVVVGDNATGTTLHGYWDSNTVSRLGSTPQGIADALASEITPAQRTAWMSGAADGRALTWARASYDIAKANAYDALPSKVRPCRIHHRDGPDTTEACTEIDTTYANAATGKARTQLKKAGVRLAGMILEALQ